MVGRQGVRIGWADLPAHVRTAVEEMLGSPVVQAVSQPGGFSPGTADRVVTAAGARAFVKAVGVELNPLSVQMHRDEVAVSRALPPGPVPAFLGAYDDGDWVALVLADVGGRHPVTPWRADELDLVLAMLAQIAVTMPPPATLPPARESFAGVLGGWRRLVDTPDPGLAPWAADRLPALAAGAARTLTLIDGAGLVHQDIRADNLLLTPGGAVLVDWPNGCAGAPWLDAVLLLVNVRLYGPPADGPAPDATVVLHALAQRYAVPVRTLVTVLTATLGYFLDAARQPPPPGLPTVRAFQRAQAEALLAWLQELEGEQGLTGY